MKQTVVVPIIIAVIVATFFQSTQASNCEFPTVTHMGRGIFEGNALYLKKVIHTTPKQLEFPLVTESTWGAITVYSSTHAIPMVGFFNQQRTFEVPSAATCVVLIDQDEDETGTDMVEMNGVVIEPDGLVRYLEVDTPDRTLVVKTYGINDVSHKGTVGVIIVPQTVPPTSTPTHTATPVPSATATTAPPTATPVMPTSTPTYTATPVPSATAVPTAAPTALPTVQPIVVSCPPPVVEQPVIINHCESLVSIESLPSGQPDHTPGTWYQWLATSNDAACQLDHWVVNGKPVSATQIVTAVMPDSCELKVKAIFVGAPAGLDVTGEPESPLLLPIVLK